MVVLVVRQQSIPFGNKRKTLLEERERKNSSLFLGQKCKLQSQRIFYPLSKAATDNDEEWFFFGVSGLLFSSDSGCKRVSAPNLQLIMNAFGGGEKGRFFAWISDDEVLATLLD